MAGDAYEHEQWKTKSSGPHEPVGLVDVSVGYHLARLGDGDEQL